MNQTNNSEVSVPNSLAEMMVSIGSSPAGSRQTEFERDTLLVDANNDSEITQSFLEKYKKSPSTTRAFRKEVTRFLFWCKLQGITYSQVRSTNLTQYLDFCANVKERHPQFVGPVVPQFLRNGMPNPNWKPFLKSLSPKGIGYSSTVLQTFFGYMCDAKYLFGNPWKLLSDLDKRPAPQLPKSDLAMVIRSKSLTPEAVRIMLQEIDDLRYGNDLERKHQPRASFLFRFLISSGARRAEVADAKMCDIKEIEPGRFVWQVIGKGNKQAWVALGPKLIEHYKHYRISLGLTPLPHPSETLPLIADIRDIKRSITGDAIYRIVKATLVVVTDKISPSHPAIAAHLKLATTHWTRHTFGTEIAKRHSPFVTRDQMRHSSLSATDHYTQSAIDQRFEAVNDM